MEIPYEYKRLEDCDKEDLINKIIVREKHCDDLKELLDKGLKKYKELEEENRKLKEDLDKIKQRVKEHTTYSIKAEFIKKFLD